MRRPSMRHVIRRERRSNRKRQRAAIVEILTHPEKLYKEYQLAEALLEHDEHFSLWRSHHIKMVERMVGTKRAPAVRKVSDI